MSVIMTKAYRHFVTALGKVRVYRWPMFVIYQPRDSELDGYQISKIQEIVRPGDILIRGFYDYLDSYLIPGTYSHAGFYRGDNEVVHAIAENPKRNHMEGVQVDHIIDFCECDFLSVLRFKEGLITEQDIDQAIWNANEAIGLPYDVSFEDGNNQYYCTELIVSKIWQHKKESLGLGPTEIKILFGLIKRSIIFPDQLYSCPALNCVYCSRIQLIK